eukprot:403367044
MEKSTQPTEVSQNPDEEVKQEQTLQQEEEVKDTTAVSSTSALKPQTDDPDKIRDNLKNLYNQLNSRATSNQDRRQLEFLKQLMPLYEKHEFWDTQPVPKNLGASQQVKKEGQIVSKKVEEVQKEPLALPEGFEWSTVDLKDDEQVREVYELLRSNYVEDSENTFRFDYPVEFLRWALLIPGYIPEWFVGVRGSQNKKLLAFISGIPVKTQVKQQTVKMAEINFLCVHKKLRTKRLAPVLIKEITRRVNITGVWQALYTAGVVVPRPISTATYYHRSLNAKKLVDVGFNSLPAGVPMARYQKMHKVPSMGEVNLIGEARPMTEKDVPQVFKLLTEYLKKFDVKLKFTEHEIAHMLLPRDGVVNSYVVYNAEKKKITDFVSFYRLPSQILKKIGHNHDQVNVAYSFYNAATVNPLTELMKYALVQAKEIGFDVFNALDIMDNVEFLDELKFAPGDGSLHYYLYNWHLDSRVTPSSLGVVLV